MKFEIKTNESGQLTLDEQAVSIISQIKEIEKAHKQLDEVKKAIKQAMEINNIEVAEIELSDKKVRMKLTPAGTQKRIDNEKVRDVLDRAGIDISNVQKEVAISSRLTITEKELDD